MSSCRYTAQGEYVCQNVMESFEKSLPKGNISFSNIPVLGCESSCAATSCDSSIFEKAKCKTIICTENCIDKVGLTLNDCNKPSTGKPNCRKNKQTNVTQPFKLDRNNIVVNIPENSVLLYDNPSNPLAAEYKNAYNLYSHPTNFQS